jgi:predicted metalloprotease with PDZ domain
MKKIFIIVILMAGPLFASAADRSTPRTRYMLSMPQPSNHLFEIEAVFNTLEEGKGVLDVLLPVWRPGRYLILDLADGVQNFSACDADGRPLRWYKINKSAWRIETKTARSVTIRYKVFANEFDKKTRGLDTDHGFVSGESVFMYTDAHRPYPVELMVLPFDTWHVTTGMAEVPGKPNTFTAPTYDYLIDCPLEIGTQQDIDFVVEGKRHVISISGIGTWNADTLVRDFSKIIESNYRFWGDLPYEKYVFLMHSLPTGGGGVEHINSTILGVRSLCFQNPTAYQQFLSLVAHEYFHTWNVKRLRPRALASCDLQHENYSHELWIAEGTTSYYSPLMLMRAGFRSPQSEVDLVPTLVVEERSRPGNAVLSLSDASFDAWIKYWHANENAYNAESDYYGKGAMVSLLLDLEIRARSKNAKSLDDVMRMMYRRFPLEAGGYTIADFQHAVEECAGQSMEDFFSLYVRGTTPLPWETTLLAAGIEIKPKDAPMKPSLGFITQAAADKPKIVRVLTGSPAEDAGLEAGDEIVALDSIRVRPSDIDERLAALKNGTNVRITYFRNDLLRETTVTARYFGPPQYRAQQVAAPTPLQKSIFDSWLQTPPDVRAMQK